MNLPSISVIIPTYNSTKTLSQCLHSIIRQDYPRDRIEIIIIDAGSQDNTLKIAYQYTNKILKNPLKTGEAGKAIGVKQAQNNIIALIDSDNILPSCDWLKRMVAPFSDPEIIGTEPIRYTYRKKDGMITRYSALMGMNDPLCYFLGNYDRENLLSEKWTGFPVVSEDRGNYLKFKLIPPQIPTIGANGFLIRKKYLEKVPFKDYFFDIDIIWCLTQKGYSTYAKVKIGIIHIFAGNIGSFIQKQKRRIKDYLYYQTKGLRTYQWKNFPRGKLVKFVLYSLTFFPTLFQSLKGYWKKQDSAWFFHPLACFLSCFIYGGIKIKSIIFKTKIQSRKSWQI
ncbi:MAG: glycosyltransferase family 2 protein [Patescibacteria group bacterium]|nr:glycosyltransferase family 2 protein [Patescibacteria group bacterium]